ncbi:phenylalanine ammonia-lyase [Puccinia sorghi]|uniref:Phenylalanine ammonia-lyase n=1 Tax=Puccinia sorghi TaxID=27349 RepID=A0A0L6VHC2_9BASI|nr:phenylalanine ammonia-lyase [Puccinia sorghi]
MIFYCILLRSSKSQLFFKHHGVKYPHLINYNEVEGLDSYFTANLSQIEFQYLIGPVKAHSQSSKGHNQHINSLAFISSRKTLEEIEILKMFFNICNSYFLGGMNA